MTACALTDHGSMAGVLEFYRECKKENIKPLIGCEFYITNDPDDIEDNGQKTKDNYHLVLIAKDNQGYKILLELISDANLHNFYYKPRVYKQHLYKCSGHVIATTACLASEVAKKAWLENKPEVLDFYYDVFGEDLYLELQDWDDGTGIQQGYNKFLLSRCVKPYKYILTCDAHFLRREDHELHELMMAMQLKKTLMQYREEGRMIYGREFYIKSSEDMLRSAKELECEQAYYNSEEIANKCNVEIEIGKLHMPVFDIEKAEDYQEFLKWSKGGR